MDRLFRSFQARIAFAHDIVMAAVSFGLSLWLRVGTTAFMEQYWGGMLLEGTLIFTGVAALVFASMRLYRGIWKYASLNDIIAILKAVTLVILIFLPVMFVVTRLELFPRSQLAINWFVLIGLLAGPRILYRAVKDRGFRDVLARQPTTPRIPVLLVGAGDGAELFLSGVDQQRGADYRAVGIVSTKARRVGRHIHGVEVLGTVDNLEQVLETLRKRGQRPRRIILTRDDFDGAMVRRIFEIAERKGISMARLPRLTDFRAGIADKVELRPIEIADLLGRPQAELDRKAMRALITGKRVLVTGAGGSIGAELVRQISDFGPAHLALLDNNEYALYEVDLELATRHKELPRSAWLADVRDGSRTESIVQAERPELVFHAAALKHVPMVEAHAEEGILTNVTGTRHVADACRKAGVGTMVLISTDKAVNPTNVMGASKRLAETYCQALDIAEAEKKGARTHFVTVRFGNVLGSTGSVVPLFQRQLEAGGPLTVTHPEVTRYFMTVREAVELVLHASALGARTDAYSGKIFVLDMGEPVKIDDLARQMIRLSGLEPETDIQIVYTGLRPGEKLYEELLHAAEELMPTEYDGILSAAPRAADEKLLARSLAELDKVCRKGDARAAVQALARLVPEYTANGEHAAAATSGS